MNEIMVPVKNEANLPDTLPDLQRFALVGREKLVAVRAEIRAIQKVGLAKEVLEQKKTEAQDIAELVTMAEVKIGAMLKEIPTRSGKRTDIQPSDSAVARLRTKEQTLETIGIPEKTAERYQRMAAHESIVREAIAEARENDDIISRAAVLRKIDEATHKPHIANNSGNNEWYTPNEYIEAARSVMGSIDCDPASSDFANRVVKAEKYYTIETDGLSKEWSGNVWLNPPYSGDLVGKFVDKLISERNHYEQAIILVNNATETEWFNRIVSICSGIVFLKGRVKYYTETGAKNSPLQGQAVLYVGMNREAFFEAFRSFGWGVLPEWTTPKKTEANRST